MLRNFLGLWAHLSVIAVLSLPISSPAQEKSKILVMPYLGIGKGVTTEIMEETTNLIGSELESSGIPVLEGADNISKRTPKQGKGSAKSSDSPQGDPNANGKVTQLITQGKTDLEDQEFESAIKNLKRAIHLLDDNGDVIDELSVLSDVYLLIATAYFQEGEEDEADDSLIKAIHFSPGRKLRPGHYPPIFIRSFGRARYNVLRRPRARLEVKAAGNAQIYLDGRLMGRAPIVLSDVLPGTHWIRAQSPGEGPRVKKLLVRSKRTVVVNLEAEDDSNEAVAGSAQDLGLVGAVTANEITLSHVAQLQSLGRKRGVDFVLFGGIHESATAYNIYSALVNVASGEVGRLGSIAFDLDLLTAQIEVYKLADDIREQIVGEEPLSKIITAAKFRLAPKINLRASKSRRAIAAGAVTGRMRIVSAAPKAIRPPRPKAAPPPPPISVATSGGRTPLASAGKPMGGDADVYDTPSVVVDASARAPTKTTALVPKDEFESETKVKTKISTAENEEHPFLPRRESPIFAQTDDRSPGASMWWIWVAVGVVVAGASGTGLYFGLSDTSPQDGELTIRW